MSAGDNTVCPEHPTACPLHSTTIMEEQTRHPLQSEVVHYTDTSDLDCDP